MLTSPRGPRCLAAEAVAQEIAEHLPELATKRNLDLDLLLAAFRVLPIEWQTSDAYQPRREESLRRMAARDPDDWPTVAVALSLGLPIWSQDKDLQASLLQVYTTGELLDLLGVE